MISFTCPGCQATFKLADELAGKSAKCSKCSERFTVPGGKPTEAPVIVAMPKKVALNPMPEVLEAEIIDEPVATPPQRGGKPALVLDDVQVVDDAAIQEPHRSRQPVRVARHDDELPPRSKRPRDDWDDDDSFDRPRRKRRKQRSGNTLGWLMPTIGGASFGLLILVFLLIGLTDTRQGVVLQDNGRFQVAAPAPNFQMNQVQPNQAQPNQGQPNQGAPPNAIPQNPAPAGGISVANGPFETQDQLNLRDPFDTVMRKSRSKRYTVHLDEGKNYTIEMIANRPGQGLFDPFLRLEQNGTSIAMDDDGAGNLDARIFVRAPQTGTYTVIATSLGPQTGAYRLSIRNVP